MKILDYMEQDLQQCFSGSVFGGLVSFYVYRIVLGIGVVFDICWKSW